MRIVELIIQVGKLVSHLRGAWQATKAIAKVIDEVTCIEETVDALDAGLGL